MRLALIGGIIWSTERAYADTDLFNDDGYDNRPFLYSLSSVCSRVRIHKQTNRSVNNHLNFNYLRG